MNLNLEHKNALVCGSSRGIGKAIALELASMGANITLAARSKDKLEVVKNELDTSKGQEHDYLIVDFSDSEGLRQSIETLVKLKNIHILINNTGGPKGGPIRAAKTDEFTSAFHNHLVCNHILLKNVLEGMKSDNYGRVINIISTSVKQPIDNLGVSNTIRGAVASWGKTMANELGQFGITVNNVLPGYTDTERLEEIITNKSEKMGVSFEEASKKFEDNVPLKRFAHPSEIAMAVGFLASPSAAYISGINLPVDGGRTKSL